MRSLRYFFSFHGRIPRMAWVLSGAAATAVFLLVSSVVESTAGPTATIPVYALFYWSLLALATKRYHDIGFAGSRMLLLAIPAVGLAWVGLELAFRRGTDGENRYGGIPGREGLDHARVSSKDHVINDVTHLNPIEVSAVAAPSSVEEVQAALTQSNVPVSIGGGRFSMGGQTASPNTLHLDLRKLNGIVWLSPLKKAIRVQAGIRWIDIQKAIDPHDLSVKIMQTYANFTVGGSLSVNAHGRYMGQGPLIHSVRAISLVLADGSLVEASRDENQELFFGAIGGYGALGVVVEVELDLADNVRVEQHSTVLKTAGYVEHFKQAVRSKPGAIFHNGDLYPPEYKRVRSVTWHQTEGFVTQPKRLQRPEPSHRLFRYLFWAVSETPFGPERRQHFYEPLFYLTKRIHWRNYEAGYDVAELEPSTRRWKTYVLQEYFVPVERFDDFVPKMRSIFRRYDVNVVNVSIRHAIADPGSLMAWAKQECFAFVVYYKQDVHEQARSKVGVWTREMIDAVLECDGCWYLPYQPHGTVEQLHRGYPRAEELFELKAQVDPDNRFRNTLWDKYYQPTESSSGQTIEPPSQYHSVFDSTLWSDRFYVFLQNIYRIYPEASFHHLIHSACQNHKGDEQIYRFIQEGLGAIKPALADLRLGLPALFKQKREMTRQTIEILGERRQLDGVVEIGSTGRYISSLRKQVKVRGHIFLLNDVPPAGPVDMVERQQIPKLGTYVPLDDYAPLPDSIATASMDLVTCFIGLHHCPPDKLDAFVKSIRRVLKPNGLFILRDHDVTSREMDDFVSVVHSVFNAGLMAPWSVDESELRHFRPCQSWCDYLAEQGFVDLGHRIRQAYDPTDNLLMAFEVGA